METLGNMSVFCSFFLSCHQKKESLHFCFCACETLGRMGKTEVEVVTRVVTNAKVSGIKQFSIILKEKKIKKHRCFLEALVIPFLRAQQGNNAHCL